MFSIQEIFIFLDTYCSPQPDFLFINLSKIHGKRVTTIRFGVRICFCTEYKHKITLTLALSYKNLWLLLHTIYPTNMPQYITSAKKTTVGLKLFTSRILKILYHKSKLTTEEVILAQWKMHS